MLWRCNIFLRYCTVLVVSTPLVVISVNFPWDRQQETSRAICRSAESERMSHDLLSSIKPSVGPCEDFYEYVCGDWKMHQELETYEGYAITENVLKEKGYTRLRGILETPPNGNEKLDVSKAKILYQACMKLPYMERVDETVLRKHMERYGYWSAPTKSKRPVENWLHVHNHYLSICGDSAFFSIDLHMPTEGQKPILKLQRTRSAYGALYHRHNWESDEKKSYFSFMEKILHLVAGHQTKLEHVQEGLREVFEFRLSLQQKLIAKEDPTIPNRMTIEELSKHYFEKGCPESGSGSINWLELFKSLYKNDPSVKLDESTIVDVHSTDYLHRLCNLLSHTRQRTIVNHLHLYFIERHIALHPSLKSSLIFAVTYGVTSTGGIRYLPPHWYSCIKSHDMQQVLGKLYTNTYITEPMKNEAEDIIKHVQETVKLQLEDVKWLKNDAKKGTIEKLEQMKIIIGYPSLKLKDAGVDKSAIKNMMSHSAEAYAFYSIKDNVMFIGSMYLQPPVYDVNLPYPFVYGSFGNLIAHEIYHLFDETAVSTGALHSIWDKRAVKHYKDNLECLLNLYAKQPIKELESKKSEKPKVSRSTLAENMPDIMGLKTAYSVYKKLMRTKNGACETLPKFDKISCDQLFFIAYARSFCTTMPAEVLIKLLTIGKHSPNRLRVNVPASNMKEFAQAFKCDLGTPMNNVDTKCDLWN